MNSQMENAANAANTANGTPTPQAFGGGGSPTPPPPPPPPAPAQGAPVAPNATPNGAPPAPEGSQGIDWGNVVAVVLISLTMVSLIFQIVVNKKQHEQIGKEDKKSDRDIAELRFNLKKAMGDKYETIVS